jgi:hypothetical protein
MRALTIHQTWAELIIAGRKRCELRSRRTHIRVPGAHQSLMAARRHPRISPYPTRALW